MVGKLKILIDFDGSLCRVETIPYIAELLDIEGKDEIHKETERGCISEYQYETNLRRRIAMMRDVSVEDFTCCFTQSLLRSDLVDFIFNHQDICEIVSCNLDCWCKPLTDFLGVRCSFSTAVVESGRVMGVEEILNKAGIVNEYKRLGYYVVFVGDSANDFAAMRLADKAILIKNEGFGTMHDTDKFLKAESDEKLIEILNSIMEL